MATISKAMKQGAQRYRAQQRRDAIARVRAYRRWLNSGSPLRKIPEIPTDGDYTLARSRGS